MNYLDRLRKQGNALDSPEGVKRNIVRDVIPPGPPLRLAKKSPPGKPTAPIPEVPPLPEEIPEALNTIPAPDAKTILDQELSVHTWEPSASRKRRKIKRFSVIVISLIFSATFIFPTFVFPKFSIMIYPKIETKDIGKIDLTLDTSITAGDIAGKKMPGLAITVEKTLSQEYEATGKKFVQNKARGTVTLYNAFDSNPQRLVVNTRLEEASGKIFHLTSAVTIPGAKVDGGRVVPTSVKVDVIADQAGDSYNISPTEFRIPGFRGTAKYDGFTAKSEVAFSGGFVGESKIATSNDITKGSEELTKRMIDALRSELDQKIPANADFVAPPGGRETAITSIVSPRPGDPGDRFTIIVQGKGRLLALKISDLAPLLVAIAMRPDEISPVKTPAHQDLLEITAAGFDPAKSQSRLTIRGLLRYYREAPVENIASVLRTSTPRKAEAYLRGRNEIDSFRLKRFPPWLWFIPARSGGLDISLIEPA